MLKHFFSTGEAYVTQTGHRRRFGAAAIETPVTAAANAMRERCRSEAAAIAWYWSRSSEHQLQAGVECCSALLRAAALVGRHAAALQPTALGGGGGQTCRPQNEMLRAPSTCSVAG
jgi:hypothetical protein